MTDHEKIDRLRLLRNAFVADVGNRPYGDLTPRVMTAVAFLDAFEEMVGPHEMLRAFVRSYSRMSATMPLEHGGGRVAPAEATFEMFCASNVSFADMASTRSHVMAVAEIFLHAFFERLIYLMVAARIYRYPSTAPRPRTVPQVTDSRMMLLFDMVTLSILGEPDFPWPQAKVDEAPFTIASFLQSESNRPWLRTPPTVLRETTS
jgi:hypothetical protein